MWRIHHFISRLSATCTMRQNLHMKMFYLLNCYTKFNADDNDDDDNDNLL